jgi:hypothetical protein
MGEPGIFLLATHKCILTLIQWVLGGKSLGSKVKNSSSFGEEVHQTLYMVSFIYGIGVLFLQTSQSAKLN